MRTVVFGYPHIIGPWVCQRAGGTWFPGSQTIGLVDETAGKMLAGVIYEDCNGASISCHIAIADPRALLTRDFLFVIFDYPFNQLKVKKLIGVVAASNAKSRSLCAKFGFELEATLKDAHPDGDLLLYTMHKSNCRWLSLRSRFNGQVGLTRAA